MIYRTYYIHIRLQHVPTLGQSLVISRLFLGVFFSAIWTAHLITSPKKTGQYNPTKIVVDRFSIFLRSFKVVSGWCETIGSPLT